MCLNVTETQTAEFTTALMLTYSTSSSKFSSLFLILFGNGPSLLEKIGVVLALLLLLLLYTHMHDIYLFFIIFIFILFNTPDGSKQ